MEKLTINIDWDKELAQIKAEALTTSLEKLFALQKQVFDYRILMLKNGIKDNRYGTF